MAEGHEIDRMLTEVMLSVSDGLDLDDARGAVAGAVKALRRGMESLAARDFTTMTPTEIARANASTAKSLDDLYRLLQFAKGLPDSRPDLGGGEWMQKLTTEQIALVMGWLEESERRAHAP